MSEPSIRSRSRKALNLRLQHLIVPLKSIDYGFGYIITISPLKGTINLKPLNRKPLNPKIDLLNKGDQGDYNPKP